MQTTTILRGGALWVWLMVSMWTISCSQIETEETAASSVVSGAAALTGEPIQVELCKYSIFGAERVDIRDRTTTADGPVGSNGYVELGSNADISGDVISGGNVFLRGTHVDGDVTAFGTVTQQAGTVVTGEIEQNASVAAVQIPSTAFDAGYQNITVYAGQTKALSPGRYGTVKVFGNAVLQLRTGTYELNKLLIESSNATVSLDIAQGTILVNAKQALQIGNQTVMTLVNGDDPKRVQFYSASSAQVVIGTDLTFIGEITAPNAEVMVYSRVTLNGSIHARRVVFDTDGHVNGVGCPQKTAGEYPLGADTITRTIGTWWPDYHPDEVNVISGIRVGIENMIDSEYVVSASMKFLGPLGTSYTLALGEKSLAPGGSATFFIPAISLPMRSETSAMQAQPWFVIKRETADDEIRTVPPIYFKHVPGSNFTQIELFDDRTVMAERGGKLAWGTTADAVLKGELLGYTGVGAERQPIIAGESAGSKIYNERGEIVGYHLGTKLGE